MWRNENRQWELEQAAAKYRKEEADYLQAALSRAYESGDAIKIRVAQEMILPGGAGHPMFR